MQRVVIDNGAHTIKVGLQDGLAQAIPNAVIRSKGDKRTYIGHEFEHCRDYSSLHYRLPFEKGYIVDWDAQKAIWDGIFSTEVLNLDTTQASLLITEPYFNLPNLQEIYDQFIFEEYEFQSYHRCPPASLIPYGDLFTVPGQPDPECCLVVDCGFSFTHVVPLMKNSIIWSAVKRIDVGGKLLTNHLKELVSYRQWNMMDETFIVNDIKEKCCYVSQNFKQDLETCRDNPRDNPIVQEYILPDLSRNKRGRVRSTDEMFLDSDQILIMNNERFVVPEILFKPDDIGMDQTGLSKTIAHSISLLPIDLQGMFWANIGLIGGSTKFSGFKERLMAELRTLAPVGCDITIYQCDDPILQPCLSALNFDFTQLAVSKADYQEWGSEASRKKFKTMDWQAFSHDVNSGDTDEHEPSISLSTNTGKKAYEEKVNISRKGSSSTRRIGSIRTSGREGIGKKGKI